MKFRVRDRFKGQTPEGEMELKPGQIVTLRKALALRLLNEGRVEPIGRAAVKIYSEILDEKIWVVAEGRDIKALQREQITDVIYTASEIQKLKGKPSEHTKAVHDIKRAFPGSEVKE